MITMDDLDHSMCISNYDWLSFFEESEECCLLQASLACPDSPGLSDGDDVDFITCTDTLLNEQQTGEDHKEPQEGEFLCVVYSPEEETKVEQEPVGSDPRPEPELPVSRSGLNSKEKERWFVTVNDNPRQHWEQSSGPVVKKKRKNKKICKEKHKDGQDHTCSNVDVIKHLKYTDKLCSDTNTKSLGTTINKTSTDISHRGDGLHLDREIMTTQTKNVKSATCFDIIHLASPDTDTIQVVSSESLHEEQSMELASIGISLKASPLHFAMKSRNQSKMRKHDKADITKWMETFGTVLIQEKKTDLEIERSQTKLNVDFTCSGDSKADDNCESTNSTHFHFDRTDEEISNKRVTEESNLGLTCQEHSFKNKFQKLVTGNVNTSSIGECDATNYNPDPEICSSKQEDQRHFGDSCKESSLDTDCGNHAESVDADKPTDNPVSLTNSIESDEFVDLEYFSSFSYDSETYHSAPESMEDHWHLSKQNSPCNLSITINNGSLAERGMHSCVQHVSSLHDIETSQIFPSVHPGLDDTSDKFTCSNGTGSTILGLSVDRPTSGSSSNSFGSQPESLPQLEASMESPEAYAKATGSNQPVYAISAFWDEMEKLTINDILHIRTRRCMLPTEEAPNTNEFASSSFDNNQPTIIPESAVLDTVDATDSDYCTNLEESKPDRSSCDFSTSDFEEEYWQFINSSRNCSPDLHDKSYQSQCTDYVSTVEEDSGETGTPVPYEDSSGQKWSGESNFDSYDVAMPHQIRKTKSMYNVHALTSMEGLLAQHYFDQSNCSSLKKPLSISDELDVITPIMCHTDEPYQISFPKAFEYLFHDNKEKCEAMSVCVYGLQGNPSIDPINKYTLSTTMNDLPLRHYCEEPVPIFSCSSPTVRELTFPKSSCIFLGTNYMAMKDISPIQILSQSFAKSMNCKQTDRAFCFSQDLSSLYLVKNITLIDRGSDVCRYQSEDGEKPVDEGEVFSMTPQMFKEVPLGQISMEYNQIPSDYQSIFSTIKQSDMCLVCIAFASWVLRSSDPEATDAWKAALLANVSALSAIQYLRQYMKKKASPQDD